MSGDSFDHILNLEDNYYQEGYALGEADGTHAGLVEGKLFGVEKGFEKAMSIGRLSGRAEVWRRRSSQPSMIASSSSSSQPSQIPDLPSETVPPQQAQVTSPAHTWAVTSVDDLPPLPLNARLGKHIENLSTITNSACLSGKNSDEAVADFDERLAKAMAKAKVISNIVAEPLQVEEAPTEHGHRSIEESGSLPARR